MHTYNAMHTDRCPYTDPRPGDVFTSEGDRERSWASFKVLGPYDEQSRTRKLWIEPIPHDADEPVPERCWIYRATVNRYVYLHTIKETKESPMHVTTITRLVDVPHKFKVGDRVGVGSARCHSHRSSDGSEFEVVEVDARSGQYVLQFTWGAGMIVTRDIERFDAANELVLPKHVHQYTIVVEADEPNYPNRERFSDAMIERQMRRVFEQGQSVESSFLSCVSLPRSNWRVASVTSKVVEK